MFNRVAPFLALVVGGIIGNDLFESPIIGSLLGSIAWTIWGKSWVRHVTFFFSSENEWTPESASTPIPHRTNVRKDCSLCNDKLEPSFGICHDCSEFLKKSGDQSMIWCGGCGSGFSAKHQEAVGFKMDDRQVTICACCCHALKDELPKGLNIPEGYDEEGQILVKKYSTYDLEKLKGRRTNQQLILGLIRNKERRTKTQIIFEPLFLKESHSRSTKAGSLTDEVDIAGSTGHDNQTDTVKQASGMVLVETLLSAVGEFDSSLNPNSSGLSKDRKIQVEMGCWLISHLEYWLKSVGHPPEQVVGLLVRGFAGGLYQAVQGSEQDTIDLINRRRMMYRGYETPICDEAVQTLVELANFIQEHGCFSMNAPTAPSLSLEGLTMSIAVQTWINCFAKPAIASVQKYLLLMSSRSAA